MEIGYTGVKSSLINTFYRVYMNTFIVVYAKPTKLHYVHILMAITGRVTKLDRYDKQSTVKRLSDTSNILYITTYCINILHFTGSLVKQIKLCLIYIYYLISLNGHYVYKTGSKRQGDY